MSFFEELRRRNVFRVGIAYLAGGWLLLQFLDILLPSFNAPDWVMQVIIVIIGVGFFISLFVAWAFELTPEGIKPTDAVHPDESITPQTAHKLNKLTIITLALVLVLVIIDAYILTDPAPVAGEVAVAPVAQATTPDTIVADKSIAVLPFVNQSNDPDQDYFADGLAEELLNRLARVQDLLVAGRTSSFYFKDRNESMAEIGRQLGVAHILEGSVRKAGNQVRVSAQLLRADNGFQLWSDTYDRNLEDIFSIQDEIAEAVTTALSVTLAAGEFNRPGMTTNVQAYEAYLRADPDLNTVPEETLESIAYLENAVAIDPNFGIAWNALYRAYESANISLPPELSAEFVNLAAPARERAQALMPESAEVLVSNAVFQRRMGNFIDAEELFLAAITRYGNSDAEANLNYGEMLWSVGRINDALPYLQRARRLDPKQADIAIRLATTLLALEQFEEARAETLRGIAANPGNGFMASTMGLVEFAEGNFQIIRQQLETASDQAAGNPGQISSSAMKKYLVDGDPAGAIQILREYAGNNTFSPIIATMIGPTAAIVGDNELALSIHTNTSSSNGVDVFGSYSIWQNYLSGMRQLEGFKDLAADAGLVTYWRTTGNWADKCQPIAGTDLDFECN